MRIAEDQDGMMLGALVITEIPAEYVPPAAGRELYTGDRPAQGGARW